MCQEHIVEAMLSYVVFCSIYEGYVILVALLLFLRPFNSYLVTVFVTLQAFVFFSCRFVF